MGLIHFKQRHLKYHSTAGSGHTVFTKLNGLAFDGRRVADDGLEYTCRLIPEEGMHLPRVISITGTLSAYAFAYDYTTGIIRIPAGEIYGDVTIHAAAVDHDTNVPAVLYVAKSTLNTYNGTESFLGITVYPTRGSTVSVTFNGVTKTVTGTLTKTRYDSYPASVYFGTYLGESDGTVATDGELIISGAYESYGTATYISTNGAASQLSSIRGVLEPGAPRYILPDTYVDSEFAIPRVVYNAPVDYIAASAFGDLGVTGRTCRIAFNGNVESIRGVLWRGIEYSDSLARLEVFLNNVDPAWWAQDNRQYYQPLLNVAPGETERGATSLAFFINGEDMRYITDWSIPEGVSTIGMYAFSSFLSVPEFTVPVSVESIQDHAFEGYSGVVHMLSATPPKLVGTQVYSNSATYTAYSNFNEKTTIVVPYGCAARYCSAEGWSNFSTQIVEAD